MVSFDLCPGRLTHLAKTMRAWLPSIEGVGQDAPVRLGVAAALALPDDSMSASGLHWEAARGHLAIGLHEGGRPRSKVRRT